MVKCTLDGREIEVEPGTTILNAARAISIDIPTFCYHDRLSISASCRMCLVEIEGRGKLEPACATAVGEDMVIHSHSEKVVGTREDMLEMLLANHPLDCPVCDKGGECELQDTVFAYGKGDSRLRDPKRVFRTRDIELNEVIVFNANRCIQCQRCVRMCEEVVGEVALGTAERGLDSEITGVGNSLKDCSHCGNCIEVCPVGALMSTPYRYKARPWDLVKTETICAMCGTGCSMTVETRDGAFKRVKSSPDTGINGELLCAKGRFGFDAINGGIRINEPMIRKDGSLTPVSWDEAIGFIAETVARIRDSGGHIQGQISPRQTNETAYLFQKLMQQVFNSDDIHSGSRFSGLREPGAVEALVRVLGNTISRKPLETVLSADCIFLLGSNVTAENPVTGYLLRAAVRDHGNHLFVASSRPSGLDDISAASLRLLPGAEAQLLSALTGGTPAPQGETGAGFVSAAKPVLANATSVTLLVGTEFLRTASATACLDWLAEAVRRLAAQGKTVDVQFLFDRPNQLGVWDMGCLPGISAAARLPGPVRHSPGGVPDLVHVLGADPARSCPAGDPCEASVLNTACLVVHTSHMSETAGLAHVVLPAPGCGEENGSYTNNEGRVQQLAPVRSEETELPSTQNILRRIARATEAAMQRSDRTQEFTTFAEDLPDFLKVGEDWGKYSVFSDKINSGIAEPATPVSEVAKAQSGNARVLITGDDQFQSGDLSPRSDILSSLAGEPYVEMNPGNHPEPNSGSVPPMVTITCGEARYSARLKINTAYDKAVVFVPENFLCGRAEKLILHSGYPAQAEVSIEW